MQGTCLRAFEKLHQFRSDVLFSTWLVRIGINNALARLREQKRLFPCTSGRLAGRLFLPVTPANL